MLHETSFQIINIYSISGQTGFRVTDTSYSRGGVENQGPSHAIALKHLIYQPSTQLHCIPPLKTKRQI